MARCSAVVWAMIGAALTFGASASARTSAAARPAGGSAGATVTTALADTSGHCATSSLRLTFGARAPADLRDDVGAALAQTGVISSGATCDLGDFEAAVVKELAEIPPVRVERAGAATAVDNLVMPSGRAALAAILASGAKGAVRTKPTADSALTPLGVRPGTAPPQAGRSSLGGALPYLLLATLVFGALVWALPGIRKGRSRWRGR